MSADEDTELRDLVAQTLETNGTLGKLRAQLRASVFLALEEQESVQNRTPFLNKELKSFLATKDGRLVTNLVREFLEFFHLEFTMAVFDPETGLEEPQSRDSLAAELNLNTRPGDGQSAVPLLAEVLRGAGSQGPQEHRATSGIHGDRDVNNSHAYPKALTEQQVADARKKFEQYDRDGSGAIDKDELRELFLDMFPGFNKHMLERYVNDEFRAVDRDFSSSIDFDEFLGMYKRLFLQCRSVVSGDVADIISPTHKKRDTSSSGFLAKGAPATNSVEAKNQKNLEKSAPPLPSTPPPAARNGRKDHSDDFFGDDPFFDDIVPTSGTYHSFSNSPMERRLSSDSNSSSRSRPSQIPVFAGLRSDGDKKKSEGGATAAGGGDVSSGGGGKGGGSSLSSLSDLPKFNSGSLTSAPNSKTTAPKGKDDDANLRSLDKRMADMAFDMQDDFEYEDDFQSSGHSLSHKSPRSKGDGRDKTENGSIAEEIDEEIEDISIEADDLLKSENSGFDDMTTDRSISQMDGGFDYEEDPQLP